MTADTCPTCEAVPDQNNVTSHEQGCETLAEIWAAEDLAEEREEAQQRAASEAAAAAQQRKELTTGVEKAKQSCGQIAEHLGRESGTEQRMAADMARQRVAAHQRTHALDSPQHEA